MRQFHLFDSRINRLKKYKTRKKDKIIARSNRCEPGYSLGNFVFDGFELPAAKRGWLLRLTLGRQGLLAWETLAAQMDEEGTPHPVPGALTPCGESGRAAGEAITANPKAGSASVRECVNR